MIPDSEIQKLRQLFIERIEAVDPNRDAGLALSGGVDSMTVLFAMLESGRKPVCYTFVCESTPSDDHASSVAVCKHFGLEHVTITIPWDMEKLVADIRVLVQKAHKIKNTIIQCMHPWLYIYPALKSDTILCGLGADELFCNQQKVQILLHAKGDDAVREAGYRKTYTDDQNFSSWNIINLGKDYGKTLVDVYHTPEINAWFYQWPIDDLHRPFEKAATVLAFGDYFKQGAFRRPHSSYQKNSKLKDMHFALLGTEYNQVGAKDPGVIYRGIYKGKI